MPALQTYITEPIWEQFRDLLPERDVDHPLGCHRSRVPDRLVFEKLVQILVFGCAYRRIADEGCSATTLRRGRDEWIEAGVMDALEEMAREAYDRAIGLDLADVAVDCCITKAPCGGEKAGPSPVDRGKQGLKRSMMVDGEGMPLGVVAAGANRHDSPLLAPTLDASRTRGGLPEPVGVHLDRGYDSDVTRRLLEERGLAGVISSEGRCAPLGATKRVGSSNAPTPGPMPTRSSSGVPRGKDGSSTSGSPFPMRSSPWRDSSGKAGLVTAGKAGPRADRDLLAQALSDKVGPSGVEE